MRSLIAVAVMVATASAHASPADMPWRSLGAVEVGALQRAARHAQRITFASDWSPRAHESLVIDLFGAPVAATRTAFAVRRDGWMWQGRIGSSTANAISLSMHRGVLAGRVTAASGNYEIVPLPAGGQALVELDMRAFAPCGPPPVAPFPSIAVPAPRPAVTLPESVRGRAGEPIDVLVVYSPQVLATLATLANVEAQAQAAVDVSNLAFANSDMPARFNLVGVRPFPRDEVDVKDLEWLRADPVAIAMRDETGADLASLWVENSLDVCGAGFIMNSLGTGFAGDAVQITARSCAIANLTYAHEHGHNMGMQHDPAYGVPPENALFPWAFGHYVSNNFTTIMSYPFDCQGECLHVAQFSNPAIAYNGAPTGIAEQRDNHRVGNATAADVASFRPRAVIFADGFD